MGIETETIDLVGRERLAQWIERAKLQQIEAAGRIGIDPTQLSQILAGKRRPGLDNAVKIAKVTGVAVEDWVPIDEDTETIAPPAAARKRNIGKT